jgi:hypothetical protein
MLLGEDIINNSEYWLLTSKCRGLEEIQENYSGKSQFDRVNHSVSRFVVIT